MIWIAQILLAKVASKMGILATVKARVVLLTEVVDSVVRLRLRLSPKNNTISPSDCILFHSRVAKKCRPAGVIFFSRCYR